MGTTCGDPSGRRVVTVHRWRSRQKLEVGAHQLADPRHLRRPRRSGSRCCPTWTPGCCSTGPPPGSGGSRSRGRGRSPPRITRCSPDSGPCGSWCGDCRVVVRRRTSPRTTPRRCRPCRTGRSRWASTTSRARCVRNPSSPVLSVGKVPCQMLHIHRPRGVSSSPHAKRRPVQAAPGGVLPLGLGRQPLPGPRGVRLGVVPGDVHDRVVLPRARRRSPDPRGAASSRRGPRATTGCRRPG